METQTTKLNEKKTWENPTLIVIDQNNINTGVVVGTKEATTPSHTHS